MTPSPPRRKKPSTSWKIITNRANGRRSRGPVTREGRRRSELNGRRLEIPFQAKRLLEKRGIELKMFQRFWRDVQFLFKFAGPGLDLYFAALAWDWVIKVDCILKRAPAAEIRFLDARLEYELQELVNALEVRSRQFRHNLRKHLGSSGRAGMWHLQWQAERRLPVYLVLAKMGRLPAVTPPEQCVPDELGALDETAGCLLFRGVRPPGNRAGTPL